MGKSAAGQSFELCSVIFPRRPTAPNRTHSSLDVKKTSTFIHFAQLLSPSFQLETQPKYFLFACLLATEERFSSDIRAGCERNGEAEILAFSKEAGLSEIRFGVGTDVPF